MNVPLPFASGSRQQMEAASPLAILIVDDDPGIRSGVSRILRQDGYRVDLAQSGAAALSRQDWSDYFAVLLDRRLPDSSADELLPQIRERAPHAAVLIITGYADLESSLAAIRAGATDYLLKPVDPAELCTRLRRLAELKQVRDQLRGRERQIQFMIEHLPAGAAYVDSRTGHLRINQTLEHMTGYPSSELQTLQLWFQTLFGDQAAARFQSYLDDRATGFPQSRVYSFCCKDGTEILGEFSVYAQEDHEVWLINDVTERQRVHQELRHQRDFLERLVATAQVIVLVLDVEGSVMQFNRFMQDLCGYRLEEVVGKSWFETFLPDRDILRVRNLFAQVLQGEEVRGHVNPIKSQDGCELQIAWWAKPLRDAEGKVTEVLSIGHDITTLRDVEHKLVQSERLAAIGQMVAGLAHESRNALQRARACLDMLSLDLEDRPQQLQLTSRIQAALDELQRLYEEVRNYAAPIRLSLASCDLAEVWQTAWQHVMQEHGSSSYSLQKSCTATDTVCVVDQHRIEQVLRNVLENAAAVSPEGGAIAVTCLDRELNGLPAIGMTITDEGPGLSAEQQACIFQPFYTTKQKGTGLGMAIAQKIIEAHDGIIQAASSPSGGAMISITLPREPGSGAL